MYNESRLKELEQKTDAILSYILADSEEKKVTSYNQIAGMSKMWHCGETENRLETAEDIAREILLELGAPESLTGYDYAVYSICLVAKDKDQIKTVVFGLYPLVGEHFNVSGGKVERTIRHLVEVVCERADIQSLQYYFGNIVKPQTGKVTNKEFIARIAAVVRERMGWDQ